MAMLFVIRFSMFQPERWLKVSRDRNGEKEQCSTERKNRAASKKGSNSPTDDELLDWLAEAPPQQSTEEKLRAFLIERTRVAFKAKDMGLLPTKTDVRTKGGASSSAASAEKLKAMGARPIPHGHNIRWAMV